MNTLSTSLNENLKSFEKLLPSEDILTYAFATKDGAPCALIYADGIVNKELLGRLVIEPVSALSLKNGGTVYKTNEEAIEKTVRFPELKTNKEIPQLVKEILDGNAVLLVEGVQTGFIAGAKLLPVRTPTEPPTNVAVKGPREGFIEDVKTNMSLLRKRLKTPDLLLETLRVGKRSETIVCICYLAGTANENLVKEIREKLQAVEIDSIPDSSYIATLLAPRKHSVFRSVGTTEKPDVFASKLSEGRIGLLVDGSPIALTLPYILMEDLQSPEDYYISPFMAGVVRALRLIAIFLSMFLPAFYVSAQLFKMQLLPLGLMLTIASSVRELPLSPSLEMFVVLFLFEVLREASIRMPKYVGMSLSIVGALVLGETAVSAGFLSTPAIIIVAVSGICLYTVPEFVETGSILRWLFLIIGGSIGPFGIVLLSAFLLCYLVSADSFNTPLLSPFSPWQGKDMKDAVAKYSLTELNERPQFLHSQNKIRFRFKEDSK